MIINETTLTKDDFKLIGKWQAKNRKNIISRMIMLAFGIAMLFPTVKYASEYADVTKTEKTENMMPLVIFCILSVVSIFFALFGNIIENLRMSSISYMYFPRLYSIDESGIFVTVENGKEKQNLIFDYESIYDYLDINGCLYVRTHNSGREMYLVIRDDGYTKGSKMDLLKLLYSNRISAVA